MKVDPQYITLEEFKRLRNIKVPKPEEKEIMDYESDLNHYKIVEIPSMADSKVSNWMIVKRAKTLLSPVTSTTSIGRYENDWEFAGFNEGTPYDSVGSAIHNVKYNISRDNFEANKIKILMGLNRH